MMTKLEFEEGMNDDAQGVSEKKDRNKEREEINVDLFDGRRS